MKYYHNIDYGNGSSFYGEGLLPLNRPIWGFAYDVNDDTERKRLNSLPVLGEVVKNTYRLWDNHAFVPYKKGTREKRKSGIVGFQARMYADTYEEAVEMYNELVQKRIENLERMIESAKLDMIVCHKDLSEDTER